MGCAHSQNVFKRINERNILLSSKQKFKVINVNDQGKEISNGNIEITDTELILHQESKSIRWPLRLLRRYGYDKNLFSFECGRRCTTGEGIYAFKCNEAEELFNVLKIATENSANRPKNSLIDQINNQSSNDSIATSNVKNNLIIINNQQTINLVDCKHNNNQTPCLPPKHFYANDIREYINSSVFDSCINKDNSPLLKQEFDLSQTNINLNYAKLEDLQLDSSTANHFSAFANNNNNNAKLIDYQNNLQQADQPLDSNQIKPAFDKKELKLNGLNLNLDHQLYYTTLNLDNLDNNFKLQLDSEDKLSDKLSDKLNDNNDYEDTCLISTAPVTPINKNAKYNDFRTPNSVPTSPTSPKHQDSIQQYSTIDFNKTKALTGIIKDLNQSDQNI